MTTEELQREWIAALRSGDYVQGNGFLCKDGKFCCLGVGAAVLEQHGLAFSSTWDHGHSTLYESKKEEGFGASYLNQELAELLGIKHQKGLSTLNDNCGYTFDQIADVLEESLDG